MEYASIVSSSILIMVKIPTYLEPDFIDLLLFRAPEEKSLLLIDIWLRFASHV